MKATIVVLNHNSGPILDKCLESLVSLDADDFEVVLIDNASTDGSRERAHHLFGANPRFRLVASPGNLGCAGGRNRGIAEADGDIVCFVDSDAFAERSWLTGIRRAFGNERVGVVASRLVSAENPLVLNGLGGLINWQGYGFDIGFGEPVEFAETNIAPLFACGNGLCTRRRVIDRIGGFDDAYFNYYEDVDFCLRARRAGYGVAVARDATLHHVLRPSAPGSSAGKVLLCERNRIRTVLKHFPLAFLREWARNERDHAADLEFDGYPQSIVKDAWRWNLWRLPGVAWWRLRQIGRLRRLDLTDSILPTWGHAHGKSHNISFRPDTGCRLSKVDIGRNDDGCLLYGWYWSEANPDGSRFRWTDDLGALRLVAERPRPTFTMNYQLPPDHQDTFVYLRHEQTGWSVSGRVPAEPSHRWTDVQLPTPLPAGPVQVIFQTPVPYKEPHPGRRALGIGLRYCALD